MTIDPNSVGTPSQPVIPPGDSGTIDLSQAPVPDPQSTDGSTTITDLGSLTIPSAAGQMDRDAYFILVNGMNGNILPNESTDPGAVYKAQQLANAWQQEFVSNPASGHNVVQQ